MTILIPSNSAADAAPTQTTPGGDQLRTRPPRPVRPRMPTLTTPARIKLRVCLILLTTVALVATLVISLTGLRGGLRAISQRNAPAVTAATDLYFVLNDMDAQVANVLLVGQDQNLGFTRQQALDIYDQRRRQAATDSQLAATAVGADAAGQQAVRAILDHLGRYQALAAETILLDGQSPHPAGRPPAAALQRYRQATDLLKSDLLPAARVLIDRNAHALQVSYNHQRATAVTLRGWLIVVGVLLLLELAALQLYLARRFRRQINPILAAATLAAVVLTLFAGVILSDTVEHLRVAKKDAYDSVFALTQARAVSYDANAYESRYLVDPARAGQYESAFLAESQQLARLGGADIAGYDTALQAALQAYHARNTDVRIDGYFGTELRNITFSGERAAADRTLDRYQVYQRDDRRIRALAAGGDLRGAIAFCTSFHPGDSNYAFDQYDSSLTALITINQNAFDRAVSDGIRELDGWTLEWAAAAAAVVLLTLLGVRSRLAEYR